MSAVADPWEIAIREHDRRVYLSVLALGLPPERAREIAQSAWARLIEQHGRGALAEIELPGLAIRQARSSRSTSSSGRRPSWTGGLGGGYAGRPEDAHRWSFTTFVADCTTQARLYCFED